MRKLEDKLFHGIMGFFCLITVLLLVFLIFFILSLDKCGYLCHVAFLLGISLREGKTVTENFKAH